MMQYSRNMMQDIARPNLRSNDVNDSHALNLWINNEVDFLFIYFIYFLFFYLFHGAFEIKF